MFLLLIVAYMYNKSRNFRITYFQTFNFYCNLLFAVSRGHKIFTVVKIVQIKFLSFCIFFGFFQLRKFSEWQCTACMHRWSCAWPWLLSFWWGGPLTDSDLFSGTFWCLYQDVSALFQPSLSFCTRLWSAVHQNRAFYTFSCISVLTAWTLSR